DCLHRVRHQQLGNLQRAGFSAGRLGRKECDAWRRFPRFHYVRVGNPENMGVVRLFRRIDEEAAKEGGNGVEDFGQRPAVNLDLVAVLGGLGRLRLLLFTVVLARSLLGFLAFYLFKDFSGIDKLSHYKPRFTLNSVSTSSADHARAISGFSFWSRLPTSMTCWSLRSESRRKVSRSWSASAPRSRRLYISASTVGCGAPSRRRPVSHVMTTPRATMWPAGD